MKLMYDLVDKMKSTCKDINARIGRFLERVPYDIDKINKDLVVVADKLTSACTTVNSTDLWNVRLSACRIKLVNTDRNCGRTVQLVVLRE